MIGDCHLLGFAELQTDLDELTGDVAECRLPYHHLQLYLLSTLFPGSKDHPIMHPPVVSSGGWEEEGVGEKGGGRQEGRSMWVGDVEDVGGIKERGKIFENLSWRTQMERRDEKWLTDVKK